MLRARLTEARWAASLNDPAIEEIEFQKIKAYSTSRNIEDLGDIEALREPLSLWRMSPMLPKHQHLEGRFDLLFAVCCNDAKDAPVDRSDFETKDGYTSLKEDSLAKVPRATALELGRMAWELASVDGNQSPFSSPGIELVNRIREVQSHNALRAHMITRAVMSNSKPSDSTSSPSTPGVTASTTSTPPPSETPDDSSSPVPTTST